MNFNDLFYKGEEISIGGRVRHIKYTNRSLKLLTKRFGSIRKAVIMMQSLSNEMDKETLDNLVILLHTGLVHEDKNLTTAEVEEMLDIKNLPSTVN